MAAAGGLSATDFNEFALVESSANDPHNKGDEEPEEVRGEGGNDSEAAGVSEDEVGSTENSGPGRQEEEIVNPVDERNK